MFYCMMVEKVVEDHFQLSTLLVVNAINVSGNAAFSCEFGQADLALELLLV